MKKKKRQLKQLKEFAKNYRIDFCHTPIRTNLLKNKEGIVLVTENACIRPDIFLDNDRYCDECPYLDSCVCKIKRVTKRKRS
jgi:hypothetical protein